MLEGMGYNVLTAGLPSKAIDIAKNYVGAIELLITDVIMPEMNGQELFSNISKLRPNIKCLFMSGYTADIANTNGILDKGMHLIQKPFSKKELTLSIKEALSNVPLSFKPCK